MKKYITLTLFFAFGQFIHAEDQSKNFKIIPWEKKGSQSELGSRCELFFNQISFKMSTLSNDPNLTIQFDNPYAYLSQEKDEQGIRKIVCSTDIKVFSERAQFDVRVDDKFRWVCSDENKDSMTCGHTWSDCVNAKGKAQAASDVIDTSIYLRGSLFDGNMCVIKTIYRKTL